MRSTTLLALALVPLAGCDWGFVSPFGNYGGDNSDWWGDTGGYTSYEEYLRNADGMTQISSLGTVANGLAFDEGGSVNVASMGYQTCRIQTSSGMWDVEDPEGTPDDNVQDSSTSGSGMSVATITAEGVRITRFSDGMANTSRNEVIPGAYAVRFDGSDLVYGAQDDGCRVGWTGTSRDVRVGTNCGGFDSTPTGSAFIAVDGDVKLVSPSGAVTDLGVSAQLIAWDSANNQLYTALVGGDSVSAVSSAGELRWTHTFDGRITSLADMGSRGAALVGLSVGSTGRLAVLDGATGSEVAYGEGSEAPSAVWSSPDGSTIGAQTSWNTHFIKMD